MKRIQKGIAVLLSTLTLHGGLVHATSEQAFINDISKKHKLDSQMVATLLAQAKKQQSIIDAMNRPAESMSWERYRKIFMTEKRIKQGVEFWKDNKALLDKAYELYGVPPHIVTAIIGVETYYGNNMGSYRVLDALYTLGFHFPRRGKFFRQELAHFILMSQEQHLDPLSLKGSYAGAMGFGQFIPSSYRHYAIDFDQDNTADLFNNKADAIGSVANYFAEHGWIKDADIAAPATIQGKQYTQLMHKSLKPKYSTADFTVAGVTSNFGSNGKSKARLLELDGENGNEYWMTLENFYVITRYNHSPLYAMAVFQLSEQLKQNYEQQTKPE